MQILLPYNIAYFSVHSLANLLYLIGQVYLALIITHKSNKDEVVHKDNSSISEIQTKFLQSMDQYLFSKTYWGGGKEKLAFFPKT